VPVASVVFNFKFLQGTSLEDHGILRGLLSDGNHVEAVVSGYLPSSFHSRFLALTSTCHEPDIASLLLDGGLKQQVAEALKEVFYGKNFIAKYLLRIEIFLN
jgi:hypothetical protein